LRDAPGRVDPRRVSVESEHLGERFERNDHVARHLAGLGIGALRCLDAVITPRVPSEPTKRPTRSMALAAKYPAEHFGRFGRR
jgi:hypothetical protein